MVLRTAVLPTKAGLRPPSAAKISLFMAVVGGRVTNAPPQHA